MQIYVWLQKKGEKKETKNNDPHFSELKSQPWAQVESMCGVMEREGDLMGRKLDSNSNSVTKRK